MSDAEGLTVGGSLLGAFSSARCLAVQNQASAFSHRCSFTLTLLIWYLAKDSWLHVGLNLLLNKHSLFLGCGMLILLVLGSKVIHVALSRGKLLFVHALTSVPVKNALRRNMAMKNSAAGWNFS